MDHDDNNNDDANNHHHQMIDKCTIDQVSTASSKSDNENDNHDEETNQNDPNTNMNNNDNDESANAAPSNKTSPFWSSLFLREQESSRRKRFFLWSVPILLVVIIIGVIIGNTVEKSSSVRGSSASNQALESSQTMAPSMTLSSSPSASFIPTMMPTFVPTNVPTTLAPTMTTAPSNLPTEIPTLYPSFEPSEPPPSASPTLSLMPSVAPSISFAPTAQFKPIDPTKKFTLRMHWEESYMWQDDPTEMFWCWECTICELNYDSLDAGVGCYDNNSDDPTCERENQIWLQRCNGHGSSTGNAEFQLWQHDTYDVIRVADTDLCLTRVNKEPDYIFRYLYMDICSALNLQQRWHKIPDLFGKPFDLRPDVIANRDNVDRCVTQLHHPKASEVLHMRECTDAYGYNTALYDALPVDDNGDDNNDDNN